jgi:hypothetical protein
VKDVAVAPVVQRLLVHAIACEDEALAGAVDHRRREHPAHTSEHALAPRLVAVQQDLGVGPGAELVRRRELPAQGAVVVDLAVDHRGAPPVLVAQRLHPPPRRR